MLLVSTRDEFRALFEPLKAPLEPPHEPAEEPIPPQTLAIGDEHSVDANDDITLRFRRTEEDVFTTTYIYRPTGAEVLERADDEEGGVELIGLDPYFWNFILNDGPATEAALNAATEARHAFRVDHHKREIRFKSEA